MAQRVALRCIDAHLLEHLVGMLGKMGAGFTGRLIETGHRVIGYDIDDAC